MEYTASTSRPPAGSPRLDCDTEEVRHILREIVSVVVSSGGHLSDRLEFRERQGQLSGHSQAPRDDPQDGSPLITLPDVAMPAVEAGEWSWLDDRLAVVPHPGQGPHSGELLELHAELYSATCKPEWYRTVHPKSAAANHQLTVRAIKHLRPRFGIDSSPGGFLATRAFQRSRNAPPCLIPLADALNHHRRGAPLAYGKGQLAVVRRQPTGTTECFVNYGSFRRDPLDLALHYGYADNEVTVATSAQLVLEVAGLGSVEILRQPLKTRSVIDPPNVERTAGGWRLSHITFQSQNPERLVVPITMVAKAAGAAAPERAARQFLGLIIERNLALIDALTATLDPVTPMGAMLSDASGYQAQIFRKAMAAIA